MRLLLLELLFLFLLSFHIILFFRLLFLFATSLFLQPFSSLQLLPHIFSSYSSCLFIRHILFLLFLTIFPSSCVYFTSSLTSSSFVSSTFTFFVYLLYFHSSVSFSFMLTFFSSSPPLLLCGFFNKHVLLVLPANRNTSSFAPTFRKKISSHSSGGKKYLQ